MSALLELAERCEKAEGPDRELDAGIALAIGWRDCIPCAFNGVKHRMGGILNAPAYTASLDAAMTLVPEGYHWQAGVGIETEYGHRDKAYAWCSQEDCGELSVAATPALALCAAALRARAA